MSRCCKWVDGRVDAMFAVITALVCISAAFACVGATEGEERLHKDLFCSLNTELRPVDNASDPVVVTIGAALQMIVEMDQKNQHLTSSLWMRFFWKDAHLHWDPEKYEGTKSLVVPLHRIWKPDIVLYNNADTEFRGMLDTNPTLSHSGVVYWNAPAVFMSTCNIDITFFPFDEQRCFLKFGSWGYDTSGIDLANRTAYGDMSSFIDNGEWKVLAMLIRRHEIVYKCCPAPFADVTFTIIMRRRAGFYLFNLVVPCLLTTAVNMLNFFLPADSGEKIGLSITVLLAMTVFLLIVAETIPPANSTPLIGKYFLASMLIVCMSTVMTVFALHLHFQLPGGRPVPLWLRKIAFGHLAPMLRVDVCYDHGKPPIISSPPQQNGRPANLLLFKKTRRSKSRLWKQTPLDESPVLCELLRVVTSINNNLKTMGDRLREQDADEDVITQWKYVARIFDRFFCLVYVVLTLITTAILLGQAKPNTGAKEIDTLVD